MRPVCKDNRNMTMPSVIPDNIAVLGGACDLQESTYGQVAHVMQNLLHDVTIIKFLSSNFHSIIPKNS